MSGIRRSLRYWGYIVEYLTIMILAVTIFVCFLSSLGAEKNQMWEHAASYAPALCVFAMCVMGINGVNYYLPFTIAMGSTRKDSILGMEIMIHLMALQLAVVAALVKFLRPVESRESVGALVITSLFCCLVTSAMCNGISAVYLKFGRTVGFVVYFILAIGGMAAVGLADSLFPAFLSQVSGNIWPAMIAILLDLAMGVFFYFASRKIEVRI